MRLNTATKPPTVAPTITPVWTEGFAVKDAVEDGDAVVDVNAVADEDDVTEDTASESVPLVEALRATVEVDEASVDTREVELWGTAFPLTTKSPLFSLQQASLIVPFPQQ